MVGVWSEDPAWVDVGIQREMKGGEVGHGRERVSECAVERTEDMSGGVDGDGEGAHDTGDGWIVGESDDDGKIVVRRGEDEMAVEDTLHDGFEERVGATECGEVGRTEVRGDEVEELDGEARGGHGGSGVRQEEREGVFKERVYALRPLAPCAHYHCHAYSPVCTIVRRTVRPSLFALPSSTPSFGAPVGSSSVSEAFSQLWQPHIWTCWLSGRARGLAPSRTVNLPSLHQPCLASARAHAHPISHAPSRKVSKTLSFFPLRDSYGTTQLVVHTPTGDPGPDEDSEESNLMTELGRIPVQSTVLIHGRVRLRPEKQRRPVNCAP